MINFKTSIGFRSILKLSATVMLVSFLLLIAGTVFNPTKAEAALGLYPVDPVADIPGGAGGILYSKLKYCDPGGSQFTGQSPSLIEWGGSAAPGQSSVQTFTVAAGTPFLDLGFFWYGTQCFTASPYVTNTRLRVVWSGAGVSGLNGDVMDMGWFNSPGFTNRRADPFRFAPPGGFTSSRPYTATAKVRMINRFSNNVFRCVVSSGPSPVVSGLDDYTRCPDVDMNLTININISGEQPPVGQIQAANCSHIAGYAFDPDRTSQSIFIDVHIDGTLVVNHYPANIPRPDVNSFFGISGNHGFDVPSSLYSSYLDGSTHTVTIWAFGINSAGMEDGRNANLGSRTFGPCGSPSTSYSVNVVVAPPNLSPTNEYVDKVVFTGSYKINTGDGDTVNNAIILHKEYYIDKDPKWGGGRVNFQPPAADPLSSAEKLAAIASTQPVSATFTTATSAAQLAGLRAGDKLCQTIYVDPDNGTLNTTTRNVSAGSPRYTEHTECVPFVNRPYVSFYGGDAVAGGNINNGQGCSAAVASPIITFLDGAKGSGSQLAAFATDEIVNDTGHTGGFASAKLQTGASRETLDFANEDSPPTPPIDPWGFFDPPSCITGYKQQDTNPLISDTPTLNSYNGESHYVGNLSIGSNLIAAGKSITVYVKGNINITGNITYELPNSWNSQSKIPSLTIIVEGNIYINPGVTQLDGVYIAYAGGMNGTGAGGTIYTCSTTPSGASGVPYGLNSEIIDICKNPLSVYGSLIAKNIKWARTANSLRDANPGEHPYGGSSPNSAETVISGPEIYLSKPSLPSVTGGGGGTQYDSVTSLPPVL